MATMTDATTAMAAVQTVWGDRVPSSLLAYSAQDIVVFADNTQWTNMFTGVYDVVFKPANSFKEKAGDYIDFVFAFVTPTFSHAKRKIYVSPKTQGYGLDVQLMVLSHEYIHWLSHEKFYPLYYIKGGDSPFRVEGITQWLTLACGYQTAWSKLQAYKDETLKTDSWLKGDTRNRDRMLKYIFDGEKTDLSSLHP